MGQHLPEHLSASVEAGFDGADGDGQIFAGALLVPAFHIDQQEGPADFLGEGLHRVDHLLIGQLLQQILGMSPVFFGRMRIGKFDWHFIEAHVAQGCAAGAQAVDAGVAQDGGEPSVDIRAFAELLEGGICF
jgi:hypothetical protein